MIPSNLLPIANHLWQSTLFAGIAGLLTLLLRDNRAHARYCLWLAASAKFLVPFSLLVLAGGQLGRHTAIAPAQSSVPVIIDQVNEPFGVDVSLRPTPISHQARSASLLVPILVALWASGFAIVTFSWWTRWRKLRTTIRAASPVPLAIGVPVLSSASFLEPGVFGVFHPVLLLPDGVAAQLAPEELQAILAHELSHVRRRDNLAAVMHMAVEAVFWFYPLVWWLGVRLIEERERACDEQVLRSGSEPQAYAEGILKICELYLHSPLKCVAGVTGASLKKRIEAIVNNRPTLKLNFAKKVALAIAAGLAVGIPVILGVTNAPTLRAQAESNQRFEVATIKPTNPNGMHLLGIQIFPGGRVVDASVPLKSLIATAFDVSYWQVTGGESWVEKENYDIEAKPPADLQPRITNLRYTWTQIDDLRLRAMLQALLIDRFHLNVHHETKTGTVYLLERSGKPLALRPTGTDEEHIRRGGNTGFSGNLGFVGGRWGVYNSTMAQLARFASDYYLHAPVLDRTNVAGSFDYKEPGSDVEDADYTHTTDSFLRQLIPELGLKLERTAGSVETLVIDHAEKPSPN